MDDTSYDFNLSVTRVDTTTALVGMTVTGGGLSLTQTATDLAADANDFSLNTFGLLTTSSGNLDFISFSNVQVAVVSSNPPASNGFQASGIKIGEVSETSAIIWTRCTSVATPDPTSQENAAPGSTGEVRVQFTSDNGPTSTTPWFAVDPDADFTRQIQLSDLEPGTAYSITVESREVGGSEIVSTIYGSFRTAPPATSVATVTAAIVTCQSLSTLDDGVFGHKVYSDLDILRPDWFAHTGDVLYYDRSPSSTSIALARQKWQRIFAFTWNQNFHLNTPSYFQKDDHDVLRNDCWPGQTLGSLTFAQGVAVNREQVPIGTGPYCRTRRWGKDLQVWFLETREYRSDNTDPDGPNKTILGQAQKDWLVETLAASDATFKIIVSPNPIVGPDHPAKNDNHANPGTDTKPGFKTEGDWLRALLASTENCFVVCGDRHWQYASIDNVTGLREYGCGPINAEHDFGAGPGLEDRDKHSFFALRGGYLILKVERVGNRPKINFSWHDIDLTDPETVLATVTYEETIRDEDFTEFTYAFDHELDTATFRFMTEAGYSYRVEQSFSLGSDSWTPVATDLPLSATQAGTLYTETVSFPDAENVFFDS